MASKQKWPSFNPFLSLEPGLIIDLTKVNKCCSPNVTQSTEVKILDNPIPSTSETKLVLEDANFVRPKMSTVITKAKHKQLMWLRTKLEATVKPLATAEDSELKKIKFDIPIPKPRKSLCEYRVSDNIDKVGAPNALIVNPDGKSGQMADANGKSVKKTGHKTTIEANLLDYGTKSASDERHAERVTNVPRTGTDTKKIVSNIESAGKTEFQKVKIDCPGASLAQINNLESNNSNLEFNTRVEKPWNKQTLAEIKEINIKFETQTTPKCITDIKSDRNMTTLVSRKIGKENSVVKKPKQQHSLFKANFVYSEPILRNKVESLNKNSNPPRIDMKNMTPNSGSGKQGSRRNVQIKTDRNYGLRKTDLKPHENNSKNYGQTRRMDRALDGQLGLTLLGCGLEKYHDNFKRHQVSYLDFLRLGNDDLLDMGVLNLEDRRKLCKLIKEISGTAYPDQEKVPERIRRKLLESESIGMMANTVKHLQQITGDEGDKNNCGVTKILELVKKSPLSLKDDSILDPVGVVIGAAKEVEKGCEMLAKETKDLRAEYQKPKPISPKPKEQGEIIKPKGDGKMTSIDSSIRFFMQQEFLAATIILAFGTLSFYGLKKILPTTN